MVYHCVVTKVLVVEDEGTVLESIRKALAPLEAEVVSAGNGREAMGKLALDDVDLIVTDLVMPVRTGVEFVRKPFKPDSLLAAARRLMNPVP